MEKGIKKGIKEKGLEIAKSMKEAAEPVDKIAKYSGLSKREIDKL